MFEPSIVGICGSPSTASSTRTLVAMTLQRIAEATGGRPRLIDVPLLPGLAVTDRKDAAAELEAALSAVEAADLVVAGSPVYKGSYTGLFKHFVDLVEYKSLIGTPVALVATGGSDRHALVIEHQLRPLFAFFQAEVLATGLFLTGRQLADGAIVDPACSDRFDRLVYEATNALAARGRRVASARLAA